MTSTLCRFCCPWKRRGYGCEVGVNPGEVIWDFHVDSSMVGFVSKRPTGHFFQFCGGSFGVLLVETGGVAMFGTLACLAGCWCSYSAILFPRKNIINMIKYVLHWTSAESNIIIEAKVFWLPIFLNLLLLRSIAVWGLSSRPGRWRLRRVPYGEWCLRT